MTLRKPPRAATYIDRQVQIASTAIDNGDYGFARSRLANARTTAKLHSMQAFCEACIEHRCGMPAAEVDRLLDGA